MSIMVNIYNGNHIQAQSLLFCDNSRAKVSGELRGVWVTTVRNNDFPSKKVHETSFNEGIFKQEFKEVLVLCQKFKLNALFFQIRPEGDAFYPSGVNPWSEYLTGVQGVAAGIGTFDPLAYVIKETHAANMEFHAWLNPYRLSPWRNRTESKQEGLLTLSPHHYARRHPDWVYHYNGQLYLDPGVPEVTEFMVATVVEVLEQYDVDAIHLDDFFYPYPYPDGDKMVVFADLSPDDETYLKYRVDANQSITAWREANINGLVYHLHKAINRYNYTHDKQVAFGISPFGIWASDKQAPGGSKTSPAQLSSLEEFVNTKLWIEAGWLDYVVPQVYWAFNDPLSPFDVVAQWWNDVVRGTKTKLYLGLGLYLYQEDQLWEDPEEIVRQIAFGRNLENVSGFVFFTFHNFDESRITREPLRRALGRLKEIL